MRTVVVAIHIDYDRESESIVSAVEGFDMDFAVVNHIDGGMAAVVWFCMSPCLQDTSDNYEVVRTLRMSRYMHGRDPIHVDI